MRPTSSPRRRPSRWRATGRSPTDRIIVTAPRGEKISERADSASGDGTRRRDQSQHLELRAITSASSVSFQSASRASRCLYARRRNRRHGNTRLAPSVGSYSTSSGDDDRRPADVHLRHRPDRSSTAGARYGPSSRSRPDRLITKKHELNGMQAREAELHSVRMAGRRKLEEDQPRSRGIASAGWILKPMPAISTTSSVRTTISKTTRSATRCPTSRHNRPRLERRISTTRPLWGRAA